MRACHGPRDRAWPGCAAADGARLCCSAVPLHRGTRTYSRTVSFALCSALCCLLQHRSAAHWRSYASHNVLPRPPCGDMPVRAVRRGTAARARQGHAYPRLSSSLCSVHSTHYGAPRVMAMHNTAACPRRGRRQTGPEPTLAANSSPRARCARSCSGPPCCPRTLCRRAQHPLRCSHGHCHAQHGGGAPRGGAARTFVYSRPRAREARYTLAL